MTVIRYLPHSAMRSLGQCQCEGGRKTRTVKQLHGIVHTDKQEDRQAGKQNDSVRERTIF